MAFHSAHLFLKMEAEKQNGEQKSRIVTYNFDEIVRVAEKFYSKLYSSNDIHEEIIKENKNHKLGRNQCAAKRVNKPLQKIN